MMHSSRCIGFVVRASARVRCVLSEVEILNFCMCVELCTTDT